MNYLSEDKMLKFHPDTLQSVRKLYGLDDGKRMKESLDLLEDWTKKQDHFVKKDFDRDYLERMLIAAKGSVERTKERLDRACTIRNLLPHFFQDHDVKQLVKDCVGKDEIVMLPKPTSNHRRYIICDHHGTKWSAEILLNAFKWSVMCCEYMRAHDYVSGYEIVLDYRHCKLSELLSAFNIIDVKDLVAVVIEGYGVSVKGIHIMVDSSFIDIVMTIAKQLVPKKLSERIHLHKNLESLHKVLQKDVLPTEFGGEEKPVHDLFAEWVDTLDRQDFKEYWKKMILAKTDESRRSSEKYAEQYLGLPGSFRALNVD